MKRTILCSAFTVAAIAAAVATQSAFAVRAPQGVQVAEMDGESCTTSDGRSGYMVSTGRGLECVAEIETGS